MSTESRWAIYGVVDQENLPMGEGDLYKLDDDMAVCELDEIEQGILQAGDGLVTEEYRNRIRSGVEVSVKDVFTEVQKEVAAAFPDYVW